MVLDNNLGNVYFKKMNLKEALDYYDKAIQINPNYYEAFYNKEMFLKKINNFPKAIECFDKALKIKADYLPALKSRSDFYVLNKKF